MASLGPVTPYAHQDDCLAATTRTELPLFRIRGSSPTLMLVQFRTHLAECAGSDKISGAENFPAPEPHSQMFDAIRPGRFVPQRPMFQASTLFLWRRCSF